jgi:hypothetical protein
VHVRGIHRAAVQIKLTGGTQLGQQQLVQRRPHPGLGPVAKPPPAEMLMAGTGAE